MAKDTDMPMQNRKAGKMVSENPSIILIGSGVHQPVRNILQTGNVVYEEHKEHGECAEYIYRSHSLEC